MKSSPCFVSPTFAVLFISLSHTFLGFLLCCACSLEVWKLKHSFLGTMACVRGTQSTEHLEKLADDKGSGAGNGWVFWAVWYS